MLKGRDFVQAMLLAREAVGDRQCEMAAVCRGTDKWASFQLRSHQFWARLGGEHHAKGPVIQCVGYFLQCLSKL